MDALAALAVVASEVVIAEPESMGPAVPDPVSDPMQPGKRKRGEPLEVAQRKVAKCQASLDGAESIINSVDAKGASATQPEKKRAMTARGRLDKCRRELLAAQHELAEREQRAVEEAAVSAAKAAARDEKEEGSRPISDAGICLFVEIRIRYQPRFDNSSDQSNNIWARILHDFNQKGREQDLPESDYKRGIPALKTLWQKFYGESKLWAGKAQRAVTFSGVHADEVEEKVKEHYNVTTSQFIKSGMINRPMAQPPWQMSGETADMGGLGAVTFGPPPPPPLAPRNDIHSFATSSDTFDAGNMGGGSDDGDSVDEFNFQLPPSSTPIGPHTPAGVPTSATPSAPASASTSATNYSPPPPPLHMGGELPSSSGPKAGGRKGVGLEALFAQQQLATQQMLVQLQVTTTP